MVTPLVKVPENLHIPACIQCGTEENFLEEVGGNRAGTGGREENAPRP